MGNSCVKPQKDLEDLSKLQTKCEMTKYSNDTPLKRPSKNVKSKKHSISPLEVDSEFNMEDAMNEYGIDALKRPFEIVENPKLFVDGSSKCDVNQGYLGDCWFLAPMAVLAMRRDLLDKVVLPNQSFNRKYKGIFKFQFWDFGSWKTVTIGKSNFVSKLQH